MSKKVLKDPDVANRIDTIVVMFKKFLMYAANETLTTSFLHSRVLYSTHQLILVDLVHLLKGTLSEFALNEKDADKQLQIMKSLNKSEHIPKGQLLIPGYTNTEIEGLAEIVKIILEQYVTSAKPSTRFSYIRLDANTKQDQKCEVSPSLRLNKSTSTAATKRKAGAIFESSITGDTIEKFVCLSRFCHPFAPSEGKDMDSAKKTLQTYVNRWNDKGFPIQIQNSDWAYTVLEYMWPTYTLKGSGKVIHTDRRPENYLLDGEFVYSYDIFEAQMYIDLQKKAWSTPEKWITPDNYHHIVEGELQVVDVSDIVMPENKDITVLQFRKGNESVHDSQLVFYKRNKVIKPKDPEVKGAVERINLLQQLTK